jgi:DNA-binding NtrC family response regulator
MEFLQAAHDKRRAAGPLRLAPGILERLEAHDWPGNVRELKAVLERAVLLSGGGEIGPRHVALTAMTPRPGARSDAATPSASAPLALGSPASSAWTAAEAAERQRILDALEASAGNQTRAAKRLGISRATLVNKLAFYRLPRPRK